MEISNTNEVEPIRFEIIFEDEYFLIINKPAGILVHRTSISEDRVFVLQELRKQVGYKVFPVHRLDRGTSGALLFAKHSEAASKISVLFRNQQISKNYIAIARGYLPEAGEIDYALKLHDSEERQAAKTTFKTIASIEKSWAINRYPSSRYSLLELKPETGRWHQIRRHLAHLRHPIIGDRRHGDNKHNNYFMKTLGINRMLLHAKVLSFDHPFTEANIKVEANYDDAFSKGMELLGFQY